MKKDENVKYSASNNKKGVLGVLEGPCADTIRATRNGRKYSDELWQRTFNDPIIQEYFDCGGIFGELGHPVDRTETDMEKIAICMPKKPEKHSDGRLYGRWDILDTPNGRILKCLCDYGYKIGISSRGNGDVSEDLNGDEYVEPETYELNAFDAVLLPAVKEARLKLVSESLHKDSKKTFKQALTESLNKSNPDERKLMKQTLDNLHISYKEDSDEIKTGSIVESKEDNSVDNVEVNLLKNLQGALRDNRELQKTISSLNEQLSVSHAKEKRAWERVSGLQEKLDKLSSSNNASNTIKKNLRNDLSEANDVIESQNVKLSEQFDVASNLRESLNEQRRINARKDREILRLKEQLESAEDRVEYLVQRNKQINEKLQTKTAEVDKSYRQLREDYQNVQHEKLIAEKSSEKQLQEALTEAQKSKRLYHKVLDKLVTCKAQMSGVNEDTLRSSLKNIKSLDDIDIICEDLRTKRRNLNKLPFPINEDGVKVTSTQKPKSSFYNPDDDIDDGLKQLI